MVEKEILLAVPDMVKEIRREQQRIDALREKLYSPRGLDTGEKVQSSGGSQEALADVVIDLEQALDEKRCELKGVQKEVEKMFRDAGLAQEDFILMMLRYYEGLSWGEITKAMCWSEATIFRRHHDILEQIYGEEE